MSEQRDDPNRAVDARQPDAAEGGGDGGDADPSNPGCPICEFIEAGPCGSEHKVWRACRGEAKEQGADYVQHCADNFRGFFGCMLSHQEYYQPFLDAFHVDVDLSQSAIDKAKERQEQEQGQQQPGAAAADPPQRQEQTHERPQPNGTQAANSAQMHAPRAAAGQQQQQHTAAAAGSGGTSPPGVPGRANTAAAG